jgi:uncharacterized protein
MHLFSAICSLILTAYLIWESARSPRIYRELKQAIDRGDTDARAKFYYKIYWFEAVSAALALASFGLRWSLLNPARLGFEQSSFADWWRAPFGGHDNGFLIGLLIGVGIALVAFTVAIKFIRRRASAKPSPSVRQSRFVPDFSYLLPTSARERLLFALVAVSAGVCEEIVFRAWLLNALHSWGRLQGWTLVLLASVLFGIAHYYQGIAGVVATTVLGVFFCGLYVGSGTLLYPIIVHTLVDLRWAVFPSMPGMAARRAPQIDAGRR